MTATVCEACGHPVALINYDKARGVVGLQMAWVHINRRGRIKKRDHRPIVSEPDPDGGDA